MDELTQYYYSIYPGLVSAMEAEGIDPRWAGVVAPQVMIETSWGKSPATKYHNYFGMKAAKNQNGVTFSTNEGYGDDTIRIRDSFLAFPSREEGLRQGVRRLRDKFNAFEGKPSTEQYVKNINSNPEQIYFTGNPEDYINNINKIKNGSRAKAAIKQYAKDVKNTFLEAQSAIPNPSEDSRIERPQPIFTPRGDVRKAMQDKVDYHNFMNSISIQNNPQPTYNPPMKFDDGGELYYPKQWNDLTMAEKAEMMKVAVQNGITTLPEIRERYNEFAKGGYVPSDRIKDRITHYEGKTMTGAIDPLSGKYSKNNSFESEAKGFYNALPEDIRDQVLSNPELADSLYSYSYNVGAGNFKKRVVPTLRRYYQGKATVSDIENSMWASGDSKLRGLQRRRAEERAGVRSALAGNSPIYPTMSSDSESLPFTPFYNEVFNTPLSSYNVPTVILPIEEPLVQAAEDYAYSKEALDRQERQDRLNAFNMLLSLSNPNSSGNSLMDTVGMLTGRNFAQGGRKYDGTSQQSQQMIIGNNYWKQQANKPTWYDTLNPIIDGGTLPEIIVTPTNDENWLFSKGKYQRNSRKPLADTYTSKVVANYLSKFENENAEDYNARISRLADAIFTTNGVMFQKNDVKEGKHKGRAHYNANTGIAKIDNMDDIFSELAHPYQSWLGNNRKGDEISKDYDNDRDPRGGTRYAYPDTYEGETHGFFEPALKEWIETGKIGRSLPILDERLSNQKIIPKNVREVTDSAASWNKQSIDNRIISMPSQLPLSKRIQYSIFDYPLLDKKKSYGGNIYDGLTQNNQQMSNPLKPNIFRRPDGSYFYQEKPSSQEINVTPMNTVFDDPSQWTYVDDEGRQYTPHQSPVNNTGTITQGEDNNPLVKAANNYFRELAYRSTYDPSSIALQGKYTMPAIAASTLLPVAGEAFAGTTIAGVPATTWANTALTAGFGAHGINHAINEGIDGWGDAAMTALEITPLGRLARPTLDAGKEGLRYTAKVVDNATRYASPSYDLYRTIGETTPGVRVRDPYVDVKGLKGTDKSYIKIKSSLENLADAKRGNKNEAYYLFAPKDIDILKLKNARFGNGKAYDGPILGSGSVDGKFVSYGEPWMEFAPSEKTALYEMPTGPRRGPSLMATDFRGNRMNYSVDEAYNAVLRDRQFHQDIKDMELDDILQFKRDNYPDLIGGIPTDIYHANQTVVPNKNWNFDKFLKTPLWKYSEDSASGQVQKELMMRWPEAKSLETPTIEWAEAARTPQITAENAASITPKVNWDADNWFKTISGRGSYSAEEATELASHVPEYRAIEQRLFDEGKLAVDSNGDIVVVGSEMSPQEYIMRQSEAFQKMNPEHHYVGVSKKLRDTFENEARDPATRNRYDVWTDRKSPKNVEEYAISQQGGYTNASQIEKIENQMSIREENYELHKEQLKWKLEHGKISQETYDRDLAALEDNYSIKQKEDGEELKVLKQQEALDPLNGGKVFDVTYPLNTAEAPVIDAEGNHWHSIPYLTVQRDAPVLTSHYQPYDPVNTTVQTDQLVTASRRHGYGVTHIDNVKDTYDGTMLNETIIGRGTPVKSVLGNTGTFDVEGTNKWRLYRSLLPPFLGLGTFGTLYGKQE